MAMIAVISGGSVLIICREGRSSRAYGCFLDMLLTGIVLNTAMGIHRQRNMRVKGYASAMVKNLARKSELRLALGNFCQQQWVVDAMGNLYYTVVAVERPLCVRVRSRAPRPLGRPSHREGQSPQQKRQSREGPRV